MDITELRSYLKKKSGDDFELWSLDLVQHLSNKKNLITLLESISKNNSDLEAVAENSFVHNLGFLKLCLSFLNVSPFVVKLNVWNMEKHIQIEGSIPANDVHNHIYDYRSSILSGRLNYTIYQESNKSGQLYFRYLLPFEHTAYPFEFQRMSRIERTEDSSWERGDNYFLKHTQLHTVGPVNEEITSTILVQSEFKKNHTLVYSLDKIKSMQKNERLSANDVKKYFNLYLKNI